MAQTGYSSSRAGSILLGLHVNDVCGKTIYQYEQRALHFCFKNVIHNVNRSPHVETVSPSGNLIRSSEQQLFSSVRHLSKFDTWVSQCHTINSLKLAYVLKLFLESGNCFLKFHVCQSLLTHSLRSCSAFFFAVGLINMSSVIFCTSRGKLHCAPKSSTT